MGGRKKRRPASLACFVQALEGSRVVVELRHDAIVRGTLASADDYLNLQLEGATYRPLQGAPREMPSLYVRGRYVRFLHLPANLDPVATVEQHRKRVAQVVREHAQQQQAAAVKLHKGEQLELGLGRGPTSGSREGGAA